MSTWTEESLTEALGSVLLQRDIDGLDEDLVAYLAGSLSTQIEEGQSCEEVLGETLSTFLESLDISDDEKEGLMKDAEAAISDAGGAAAAAGETNDTTAPKKLKQGIVNMSSTLSDQTDTESNQLLWGSGKVVKANANTQIDMYHDKTSAKDKRKQRQDLEKSRRDLAKTMQQQEQNTTKAGVSSMKIPTVKGKERDVLLHNVSVSLDNGTMLLDGVDLKFAYQRRYAVVGENGVGKSTLLHHLANWSFEGFPTHLRVLHVRQELSTENEETTCLQAVLEADVEVQSLRQEEKRLLAILEQDDGTSSSDGNIKDKQKLLQETKMDEKFSKDLERLKEVYERLQLLSADTAKSRASMILSGLQFTPEMQMSPISGLSGGWRMRVALAAALLIEPDLLMLDEPTNHLDLEAVIWLEHYLQTYPHTVIVVSHDRGFLNEICTDTIEFKNKKLTYWRGNFDMYVKSRKEKEKNDARLYEAYKTKRDHMMEFIEKFRANAKRASIVQSRIKAVEKMDAEAPQPVVIDPVWRFSIPSSGPLGRPIISVNDVSFDYTQQNDESRFLLQKVNFGVDLDSRIAILGANGQGKTTLLNLIMGKLTPIKGTVTINSGLRIGHFTQQHADSFNLSLSAVENLLEEFEGEEEQTIRSFLGKFQIQGTDALKPMSLLSGGQKSRVAFAALAFKRPHVLIIDEGSNHLSMDAADALVEAVKDFKGGVMVVSHDQHFVSNTCSELWVVSQGQAKRFNGTFDEYKKETAKETSKRVEESVKRMAQINN